MILAAILLKLGAYGILRILLLDVGSLVYFQPYIAVMCLISIYLSSFIAMRQTDLKKIIAYSSIAHINFALLGLFSGNIYGIVGGFFLIFSHAMVSAGLFFIVGVLYDRHHSRNLYDYGGLAEVIPVYSTIMFIFIISNFSFPLSSNFVGELLVFIGLAATNQFLLYCAGASTIFTVIYSLLLFNRLCFGNLNISIFRTYVDMTKREFYVVLPLLFFNVLIGIFPTPILDFLTVPFFLKNYGFLHGTIVGHKTFYNSIGYSNM